MPEAKEIVKYTCAATVIIIVIIVLGAIFTVNDPRINSWACNSRIN
jgi:hypothetical protein